MSGEEVRSRRRKLIAWSVAVAALAALVGIYFLFLHPRPIPWKEYDRRCGAGKYRKACWCNLRQIALACKAYAEDNDGRFPAAADGPTSLQLLVPTYIDNAKVFKCPFGGTARYLDFRGGTVSEKSTDYAYERGLRADMPGEFILAYDKTPRDHHGPGDPGRHVAYINGWGAYYPTGCEQEFQRRLAAQRKAIAEWRTAEGEGTGLALKRLYERILKDGK